MALFAFTRRTVVRHMAPPAAGRARYVAVRATLAIAFSAEDFYVATLDTPGTRSHASDEYNRLVKIASSWKSVWRRVLLVDERWLSFLK